MQKQEQLDGFVSFMVEKDDSYIQTHNESVTKQITDEDFYRQLSRQFYGQGSECSQCYHQLAKKPTRIDPTLIKQKIISRALLANAERAKPGVSAPTVSEQLQKIQRLLSSSKPKMQSSVQGSFKTTIPISQKAIKIKNPYQQTSHLKLSIPIQSKKINIFEPRTQRLRIEDSNGDQFNQNSYRSTLNSSTKSTAKLEKNIDIYYPIKMQTHIGEEQTNLFKISFRNK